jgi:hypothetical protein
MFCLQKLQHANQVLQQKLETDARLHRQAQASANKDRLQLEEQVRLGACLMQTAAAACATHTYVHVSLFLVPPTVGLCFPE